MRLLKSQPQSMFNMLGSAKKPESRNTQARTEAVRAEMLRIMSESGLDAQYEHLFHKIRFATSAESLWYARSELMFALATAIGERRAHEHLIDISERFAGLITQASLFSRRLHLR